MTPEFVCDAKTTLLLQKIIITIAGLQIDSTRNFLLGRSHKMTRLYRYTIYHIIYSLIEIISRVLNVFKRIDFFTFDIFSDNRVTHQCCIIRNWINILRVYIFLSRYLSRVSCNVLHF